MLCLVLLRRVLLRLPPLLPLLGKARRLRLPQLRLLLLGVLLLLRRRLLRAHGRGKALGVPQHSVQRRGEPSVLVMHDEPSGQRAPEESVTQLPHTQRAVLAAGGVEKHPLSLRLSRRRLGVGVRQGVGAAGVL